jgi:hypothetical protein
MLVNRAQPPPPPLPRFGKFSSTARCKALQSLYCTIRRLFVIFVDYSRTIRTIRRLFADYSYYSSTIRTIRTIRFTINCLNYTHFYTQNYETSLKNTLTSNVSFMSQKLLKIANVNKLSKDILNRI